MPLASLHLISLTPSTTLKSFITLLKSLATENQPITISKVVRWIITPELIDTTPLLSPEKPYDLLVILPNTNPLPENITTKIHTDYTLQIGIPSRLLKDFKTTNTQLLHPHPSSTPELTGSLNQPIIQQSSQSLSLSPDLQSWIKTYSQTNPGKNAVSMLNLLSFHPELKDSYLKYGAEFAKSIGSKRGGNAKLVGHTIYPQSSTATSTSLLDPSGTPSVSSSSSSAEQQQEQKWDEFALAHYPTILHFADMLASSDYQEVNQKYRVPSLKDTCILCTSEIEIEELMGLEEEREQEGVKAKAKL